MKKRILFVGESPYSITGNANMMRELLSSIDTSLFDVACFGAGVVDYSQVDVMVPPSIFVTPGMEENNVWGHNRLLSLLIAQKFDIVLFVGIDIWRYEAIYEQLNTLRERDKFVWGHIFPYDLQMLRKDWLNWILPLDLPLVYSEYGYNILKDHVPNIQYFRPPLANSSFFHKYSDEEREIARKKLFPAFAQKGTIFSFIGGNQIRKDPQRHIKAFSLLTKNRDDVFFYLHCPMSGIYNLYDFANSCGLTTGQVFARSQDNKMYSAKDMSDIYNASDAIVNCTLQEGLSWVCVESMLCGTPVIASKSTAHIELLKDVPSFLVPLDGGIAYIPSISFSQGSCAIECGTSSPETICTYMLELLVEKRDMPILWDDRKEKTLKAGQDWLSGISDINKVLSSFKEKPIEVITKEKVVLFAQHSSAGDVLMTTQCFKGIKERHPNMPLHYMTSKQFMNIVEENPYIDKIISWDDKLLSKYEFVYNPHGERILPGGFNSLDTRLHEMYPYFCRVTPDAMLIVEKKPNFDLPEKYIVVHTTGGDPVFRNYKHMALAVRNIGYSVVQVGGKLDDPCLSTDCIDIRGKLSWRETAWVMKRAKAAVVIDSFPSHLAGALGTPVVVLYGPAPARVVGPKGDPSKIINLEPNKLDVCKKLTNCWGADRTCTSPCINTISPLLVKKALKSLLGEV